MSRIATNGTDVGRGKILYRELSYLVVGCAQRVHTALGPGFSESVYHRALCQELMAAKIVFQSQAPFEVFHLGALCGSFKVDILVDGQIVLELKAVEKLCPEHVAQALAYLKASSLRLALLINFGENRLCVKRIVH